jgi:hypothetical protein
VKLLVLKGVIKYSIKIVSLFIVLILMNSCDSKVENLKNKEMMDYILLLEEAVDSLNQKVDSLNSRVISLEEYRTNEILSKSSCFSDVPTEGKKIVCPNCNGEGSKYEVCGNCRGSGYSGNSKCYRCNDRYSSGPVGYRNSTCSVCNGRGRINEYE